jgi:hypothetical protein
MADIKHRFYSVSKTACDKTGRFQSGNPGGPGRPKGRRSALARALDDLVDQSFESIARAMVREAEAGNVQAARLVLQRRWSPGRVTIALPPIGSAADLPAAVDAVIAGICEGELTPQEAAAVISVLEQKRKALEIGDLEVRLRQIESRAPGKS